jgi:hypothetical protein
MSNVNERKISVGVAAQFLGHKSSGRVRTLIREGKLTLPLTFGQVREYADSRGKVGSKGDDKWYQIRLTPEQFAELSKEYTVKDPYDDVRKRAEAEAETAKAELAALMAELA